MYFKSLKKYIKHFKNKKQIDNKELSGFISIDANRFSVVSALYSNFIDCRGVKSSSDIYSVIERYQLSTAPFYVRVSLVLFDKETIDIINQLDDKIFIELYTDEKIDANKCELLSKITHRKCYLYINGYISLDDMDLLLNKCFIDDECSPVIVIDKIDSRTIDKINRCNHFISEPRFRIDIKDGDSLKHLYDIISSIPEDEIIIQIDGNIFSESNYNNARDLIVCSNEEYKIKDKKLRFLYNGIEYETLEQIFELERYLEIIKSHIPSGASEIDIVTYVSLFIIKYFKYDWELCNNIDDIINGKREDTSLLQFISEGKGVCRHYAMFTMYLLNSLGIDCKMITAVGIDDGGHAFNMVKINGKLHLLDNTWLANEIEGNVARCFSMSSNYLRSAASFGHEEYYDDFRKYDCEDYDREDIRKSVSRVMNWSHNYTIHLSALRDLFRKYILGLEKSVDERLKDAISRRR